MTSRGIALALSLLLPAGALAQSGEHGYPQLSGEIDFSIYAVGTYDAPSRRQRGTDVFLRGEISAGLFLTPDFSIQGVIETEPVGETEPNGGLIGFRYGAAFVDSLFADWRVRDDIRLFAGKFSAPFGYGHHGFAGILASVRAEEVYKLREQIGAGLTWTFLSDPALGTHDLTVAAFTFDTSALSQTAFTRKRLRDAGEFERYYRNTRAQGGAGNTGQLDNAAIALDGDRIGGLPGFAYHLAVVTRGAGRDGTAREWGYAAGVQQEIRWTDRTRSRLFFEHVAFRGAGGNPLIEDPETGETAPARGTRRFTTLGVQTTHGPWRATAMWQRDAFKRSLENPGTARWVELSVGRDIGWGFGLDVGWQVARQPEEDGGPRRDTQAVLGMLRWRAEL
jgi:hypothetical protein